MEKIFYVYLLIDPRSGKPFYVGKGCGNRMYCHIRRARESNKNSHKLNKIRKIISFGLDIIYKKVFNTNSEEEALKQETKIIKEIGLDNLTNIILSGKGGCGLRGEKNGMYGTHRSGIDNPFYGKHHTEQTKQILREINLGKKYSDEVRKKMGSPGETNPMYGTHRSGVENPFYGKKHTEEARVKMSVSGKGKIISEEWRRKLSESVKRSKAEAKLNPGYWSVENKHKRSEHSKRSRQTQLRNKQNAML